MGEPHINLNRGRSATKKTCDFELMNMRHFRWCRQELAENCRKADWHVHICISSPGYRIISPECGRPKIGMLFYDLDPEAIRRSRKAGDDMKRAQELIDQCFYEDDASRIVKFLERYPEGDVIVNCEAGVSRSPGVVLALRRAFGGDTEECFRTACPNIHVASVLGKALGVGPFQARPPSKEIIGLFSEQDES